MTDVIPVVIELMAFVALCYAYYSLCANRVSPTWGKWLEILSLYGITLFLAFSKIKVIFWFIGVAAIGLIKILTTKKQNIERRIKGHSN